MRAMAFTFVLIAACKVPANREAPPPIIAGKCIVDEYAGSAASKQTCTYGGYAWACELHDSGRYVCTRRGEWECVPNGDGTRQTCTRRSEITAERVP